MSGECKVSVVIPIYNAERHLQECLRSVASQTMQEIEVICVDDGSTDRSAEIIQEFIRRDSRFSLIEQANQYAGVARNNGLKNSHGKYVVFWDADDIFEAEALAAMYQQMEMDEADVCVCDAVRFKDGYEDQILTDLTYIRSQYLPEERPFSIKDIPDKIFNFTTDVPWNKMFRRAFVNQHGLQFEDRIRANDHYFILQAIAFAKVISLVEKPLIRYRVSNEASLTAALSSTPLCTYEALLHAKETLEEAGVFEDLRVRKSIANRAINSLLFGMEKQRTAEAFTEVYRCLKGGGLAQFYITVDMEEDFIYSLGSRRKYKTLMESEPLEYLLAEHLFVTGENATLRTRREQLKQQVAELKETRRELHYIKGRKWYQMIAGTAKLKNNLLGKNK